MPELPKVVRGLYLVPPHGTWLLEGSKRGVLKSKKFEMANEWLAIIEDQLLLGVGMFSDPITLTREQAKGWFDIHKVSTEEMDSWWPEAEELYLYPVQEILRYPSPIQFDVPPGVQTFIERVELPHLELLTKSETSIKILGIKGFLPEIKGDFASILLSHRGFRLRVDKGSQAQVESDALVITHAHPDHIGAILPAEVVYAPPGTQKMLSQAGYNAKELPLRKPTKLGPFIVTPYPVIHSTKAPSTALRISWDDTSIVYAPDIVAFESREDREACLEGASIYFGDGSAMTGLVRRDKEGSLIGHAAWSTQVSWAAKANVPKVIFTHLGGGPLTLPEEELQEILKTLSEKHGVEVSVAKPGQVITEFKKLQLERFRVEGLDFDIENAPKRWRELLADLRYLGNAGFPRLKAGQPWGEWDLETLLRYFGKIVDTLRGIYFPLVPPEKGTPEYQSSYWEAYREAARRGFIKTKPPKVEEVAEWEKKRKALLKDFLYKLWENLPGSFLVIPTWASLTGSLVYPGHPPRDVDIVLKANAPSGSLLKLQRAIQEVYPAPVEFSLEEEGPTWDYMPLYDLVAVKVPFEVVQVREPEGARAMLYKALVTDPAKITPEQPFVHYDVAGEYYIPKELRLAWDKWARRIIEKGEDVVVQPKLDGIRLHWTWDGKQVRVFPAKGHNQGPLFPGLERISKKLGRSFYLDCEFVQFETKAFKEPLSRTLMTWMGTAKRAPEEFFIKISIHDIAYLNGKNVAAMPYVERLALLKKILPRPIQLGRYMVEVIPTATVHTFEDFERAVEGFSKRRPGLSTEGAMLKRGNFLYNPNEARTATVKLKVHVEIDFLILGYRRLPKPKPEKERLTEAQARRLLAEPTDTYICRVGLRDEKTGKIIPIDSRKKLTERDLKLAWNEEKQIWEGTDDPEIWTMFFDLPHRERGNYAYGNTYALRLDTKPKEGMVVTVAPMEFTLWTDEEGKARISFQHPIATGTKEPGSPVSTIQTALAVHGKEEPKVPWAVLLRR